METFNVNFLQPALNDLDEIVLYMASYSTDVAIKWHDRLIAATRKLERFPEMGAPVPDSKLATLEFRMIPIGNYIIFYRIYPLISEVTILRVLDARRDYPRFFRNYMERDERGK